MGNMEEIRCPACDIRVGTVTAVERKPGFYSFVCVPDPMPKKCLICDGALFRINLEG